MRRGTIDASPSTIQRLFDNLFTTTTIVTIYRRDDDDDNDNDDDNDDRETIDDDKQLLFPLFPFVFAKRSGRI